MRQIISLAALLSLVCAVSAQTGNPLGTSKSTQGAPKEKSGLEKALEEALKTNPDLRVAAAKVHEAEATLSRARLQVTQKVVTAYQAVEIAKATVSIAQRTLERLRNLQKSNAVAAEDVSKAEQELTAAKGKLATAEADLNYLLGKAAVNNLSSYLMIANPLDSGVLMRSATINSLRGLNTAGSAVPLLDYHAGNLLGYYQPATALVLASRKPAAIPAADKIRKALDRRITMKFNDTTARDALKMIMKEAEGLHIQAALKDAAWNEKITATLTDVPLGAVLQLLEDTLGDYRTIVRGYGLLIASRERMPAGAVPLADFWQGGVKSDTPATNKPAAK
jgi:hypothetical protein